MADVEPRKIGDLRVVDLRNELETRGLDKSGVKSILLERLEKALKDEGHNPEEYTFDSLSSITGDKKTPMKRASRSESTADAEAMDASAEDLLLEDDKADAKTNGNAKEEAKPRKREAEQEDGATSAKNARLDADGNKPSDINGMDAEDSINLDIGEDELLNEEGDAGSKTRKDEGDSRTTDAVPTKKEAADGDTEAAGDRATDGAADEHAADAGADGPSAAVKTEKDEDGKKSGDAASTGTASTPTTRNLWVSGLSGTTRAKDLKQICSKYGKVIGAKVVTNARKPGSRCYGYVTMSSDQDAESCIKHLHLTELHGRMIMVEKARSELSAGGVPRPAPATRGGRRPQPPRQERPPPTAERKGEEGDAEKDESKKAQKEEDDAADESHDKIADKKDRPVKQADDRPAMRGGRVARRDILSYSKIRNEREAERIRDRSRSARRRRANEEVLRERERRTRQEKHRLAMDWEKLRVERERVEREKNELLRLERDRQKLEREKLELERLELKRAQMRLEEERAKRTYAYERSGGSSAVSRVPPKIQSSAYDSRHKTGGRFEAPPPPSFDSSLSGSAVKRDRERDTYKRDYIRPMAAAGSAKYSNNGPSSYDSRQPIPPGTRNKDHRYDSSARGSEPVRSGGISRGVSSRGGIMSSSDRSSTMYRDTSKPDHSRYDQSSSQVKEYAGGWSKSSSSYPSSGRAAPASGWTAGGASGGSGYESRYASTYQPAPPGAASYSDSRYQPNQQNQHYRPKY